MKKFTVLLLILMMLTSVCPIAQATEGTALQNSSGSASEAGEVILWSGPGESYEQIGTVKSGEQLVVTATVTVGDTVWGRVDGGWIKLQNTNYDAVVENGETSADNENTESNSNKNSNNKNKKTSNRKSSDNNTIMIISISVAVAVVISAVVAAIVVFVKKKNNEK